MIQRDFKWDEQWIKLHIITDGERIVEVEITGSDVGDSPVFRRMFKRLRSRENFNIVDEDGHKALFKMRMNSSSLSRISPARRKAVLKQREKD